jgi:hypothetical protein
MSRWRAVKAKQLLAVAPNWMGGGLAERLALSTQEAGWANYTFAFHDHDEIGAGLLTQISKKTGLQPEDL